MPVAPHPSGRHVFVTGGAGYVGSVLVPVLLDAGYEVSVVDRFLFGKEGLSAVTDHDRLHLYEGDIRNLKSFPNIFPEIDAVIHLASISNDPTADLDPNLTIETNYLATTALAHRARAEGVQQFIFASSCSVYGANSSRLLDELSHTGPLTLYALTKLASERDLLELSSNDFRVTVLRFSTLFGLSPRMRFDLAVNSMTKNVLQGKPLVINGSGNQYRPFIHVRDAVESLLLVVRSDPAVVRGQLLNVGADRLNFTITRLAEEIQELVPGTIITYQPAKEDTRSYRVRFQKVFETLRFTPQRSVADAVAEITVAFQRGQLGTMEEPSYYNLAVLKEAHRERAQRWAAVSSPTTSSSG